MPRKRHTAEQVIGKLREAEVSLSGGQTVPAVCRTLGVSEQTYYRWRKEYGGLKIEQARRFKELERENLRLRRAVADLTLDKLILKDRPLSGNFGRPNGACGLQDLGCFGTDVLPLAQGVRRPKDRAGTALQGARAGESAAETSCR